MPRSKNGKKREKVDVEALRMAIKDVLTNGTKVRTAAKNFDISKTTLSRHLKNMQDSNENEFVYRANNDVKKVFTLPQEIELVEYLKQAAKLHYGLNRNEVLKLAYQYGYENNLAIPENWKIEKKAGDMWLSHEATTSLPTRLI